MGIHGCVKEKVPPTSHACSGLLSVALHPSYDQNGRLFAYYITTVSGKDYAYVSEFRAVNDVVDVTSERQLLRMKQLSDRGNGGQVRELRFEISDMKYSPANTYERSINATIIPLIIPFIN